MLYWYLKHHGLPVFFFFCRLTWLPIWNCQRQTFSGFIFQMNTISANNPLISFSAWLIHCCAQHSFRQRGQFWSWLWIPYKTSLGLQNIQNKPFCKLQWIFSHSIQHIAAQRVILNLIFIQVLVHISLVKWMSVSSFLYADVWAFTLTGVLLRGTDLCCLLSISHPELISHLCHPMHCPKQSNPYNLVNGCYCPSSLSLICILVGPPLAFSCCVACFHSFM